MTAKHPQSYQPIGSVLDMLGRIHSDMSRACRKASTSRNQTRYALVAEAFAERQEAMAALIAESRKDMAEGLSSTWVQYVPTDRIERLLEKLEGEPMDSDHLPVTVVRLQNEIAQLSEAIQRESPSIELEELLGAVVTREFAEARAATEAMEDIDPA